MPFHVEIGSAVNRALAFDLSEEELQEMILEPWVAGLAFEFGGGSWSPRESRLAIMRAPALERPSGDPVQDWLTVLQRGEDVTRRLLETAEQRAPEQAALSIEADSLQAALKGLRSGRKAEPIRWSDALERLAQRDPTITAVILVTKQDR
jgi:hypothetical protein